MNSLISLAHDICREHEHAYGKAREALEHARRAGELLIEAKAVVEHGQWLPWLATNVPFSERTAQGYMRLASRWPELEAKSATVADLPLRAALKALAEPDEGASIARRLHDVAVDCADEHADDAHLHARMKAITADASEFIEATTSMEAVARIADAAKEVERAAAARRVHAMRMLGKAIKAMDERVIEAPLPSVLDTLAGLPDEVALFVEAPRLGFVYIAESLSHPGYWHYCLLHKEGEVVEFTDRPVVSSAIGQAIPEPFKSAGRFTEYRMTSRFLDFIWEQHEVAI